MRRRKFLTLLGGVVAWPLAARAQQPALPVIGFIDSGTPGPSAQRTAAFRQGLGDTGYVEGRSVTIEYRFANEQYDRVPELTADLIRRQAAVMFTSGDIAAFAAKAATTTIPIVFYSGGDPVRTGLVASLNRPSGNLTGVTTFAVDLTAKRLEVLHELLPDAAVVAFLIDENNADAVSQLGEVQEAARRLGLRLVALNVRIASDIDAAFMTLMQQRANALLLGSGGFLHSRRDQIIALAARYAVPTVYAQREDVEAGGLINYGNSQPEAFRQAGVYAGRILKGAKPADLPIMQATKFELVINLKTAKALGLSVPPTLIVRADEVIE